MRYKLVTKMLPIALMISLGACGKKADDQSAEQAAIPAKTEQASDIVVKLGSAEPLTGELAHLGKDSENGSRLAVEEINAKGDLIIDGKKVKLELVSEDDAADPKTATQVAQKLVDEKVVALVGHLNSGTTIPASKIYSDAGIVQISPSATNPAYTLQGFKTAYRLVGTDAQQGPALASYVVKNLKPKRVAIIDDATAYGKGLADQFGTAAKAQGITVVAHEATNDKATDFKAILTKIKSKKPDVIMFGGMDAVGGPLAKQAKQLNIKAVILGGDGICTAKMPELAGEAIENIICSNVGLPLEKMEHGADFNRKYQARFGQPVVNYSPLAYDAVYIIADAMRRANSIDPSKILSMMPSSNYNGLTGPIAFDSNGDLKNAVITLYKYKNKSLEVLDTTRM